MNRNVSLKTRLRNKKLHLTARQLRWPGALGVAGSNTVTGKYLLEEIIQTELLCLAVV